MSGDRDDGVLEASAKDVARDLNRAVAIAIAVFGILVIVAVAAIFTWLH